jgi:cellulose synthase/poly-beta-1,6-N-acetylglucosamine synthase-like glycosyltransferase
MKILFARMLRAIKLDQQLFEEIAADPSTQPQSVWAVAIFAMATSFGFFSAVGGTAVNIALITTMIAWYVWAFTIFYIGSRLFLEDRERAHRKTVMRVVAFAAAPGLIRLLGVIPQTSIVLMAVSSIWILVAAVLGLKKVFTQTATVKVAVVTVGAWLVASLFQAIMIVTLLSVFGVSRSGP